MAADTRWYAGHADETTFTISSADELAGLADIVNGDAKGVKRCDFRGKTVMLAADIDLSGYADDSGWSPIGNKFVDINDGIDDRVFAGTFDGGGHVVRNLAINRPDGNYQGLFGCVRGGTVKNLRLIGANVKGANFVDCVAGYVSGGGAVENCGVGEDDGATVSDDAASAEMKIDDDNTESQQQPESQPQHQQVTVVGSANSTAYNLGKRLRPVVLLIELLIVLIMILYYVFTDDNNWIRSIFAKAAVVEPEMVFVQGGTFMMGGDDGTIAKKTIHRVTISDYYIGKYPVTQRLWMQVMGNNPSEINGEDLPIVNVSWNEIVNVFLPRLNKMTGKAYRLPTEAEWEYAARGGVKSNGYKYAGGNGIDSVAWYKDNSNGIMHVVGTKIPNELGIYDMSGNVNEWMNDWEGDYSSDSQINPTGPSSGSFRVHRGGCWFDNAVHVISRSGSYPDKGSIYVGFRLALSP